MRHFKKYAIITSRIQYKWIYFVECTQRANASFV
jgi:hypothetical protein